MGDETTRLIERPRTERVRQRPRLSWRDRDEEHALTLDQRTLIGTASGARVQLSDPTVSRIHAELVPLDDGVWVSDLGSRNGTYVENVLVKHARVPPGGKLRVGQTLLTVGKTPVSEVVQLWPEATFGALLGQSAPMRELFAQLSRIAPMPSSVLIHGETGTGKELVARAIHDSSPRAKSPFVIIDCAALPEHLLESELFGHVRGAFTGAIATREGALEAADGGTVFLDEIGELPLTMQPKLLRAIESRTIRRIGETSPRTIDVRFISATHRDLRTMVNAGAFREDLYFRLAVLPVEVPPLRERAGDIPLLVEHFLPADATPFASDTMHALQQQPWLGNVRELRNFVERIVALGSKQAFAMESRPSQKVESSPSSFPVSLERPFKEVREAWLDHLEREYVRALIERHGRNIAAAAAAAEVDRTYIYRLIKRHNL